MLELVLDKWDGYNIGAFPLVTSFAPERIFLLFVIDELRKLWR